MTLKYKKITRRTWDINKNLPKCPSKGAFEIDYYGDTYFILDGKLHREDGPAWIWSNGSQYYYQNDKCHRTDGLAIIWNDGSGFYFLFDEEYTKEDWELKATQLRLKEEIV